MTNVKRATLLRLGLLIVVLLLAAQRNNLITTAATPPATNTPRNTQRAGAPFTNTARPTLPLATDIPVTSTFTETPSKTPTLTNTSTPTRTPSLTRTFTPSKTYTATKTPPPTLVIMGTYSTPVLPLTTAIPYSLPTPQASGDDIVTILVLGSDTITEGSVARTDVIILVAINRTAGTVSMIHIPRDTYVYAPNLTMMKINTVMHEANVQFGPGQGAKVMKEMIKYNFGIDVNFYARVDFASFTGLLAKMDGLDISIDCAMQGHRLKPPYTGEYNDPANWELYTLPIGYRHLDPYMVLWYVRARGSSSDFDRGQRQMSVLRALWRQIRNQGMLSQVAELWPEVQKFVDTDMTLQDIIGLTPVAIGLDPVNIQRIPVDQTTHFTQWYTSDNGSYALLLNRDAWTTTMQNFMMPPSKNRLGSESPTVEVGASIQLKGYEQVAVDTLSWAGFAARSIGQDGVINREGTVIYDYTSNALPNSRAALQKILRAVSVIDQPDPNRTVDFRVEMGRSYGSSCIKSLPAEFQVTDTPNP